MPDWRKRHSLPISEQQKHCPKCGWMYCEGYWEEGVCRADMNFCGEPTADGDNAAFYVRQWYEKHRETWWERRHWRGRWVREGALADNLILGLMAEIGRVEAERERQLKERKAS
jgi:hypothetical protein